MKSKVEFYDMFFGTLNKKGFSVMEPSSPDYLADIGYRDRTIAFYTKSDSIMKNPFLEVQEKLMERIQTLAVSTVNVCGICAEKPYEDDKVEHMPNGIIKINEHDNVVLACKYHPLFGYVLSTYRQDTENNNAAVQRQYFYSKEEAFESFASRSGLVDGKKLFGEEELKIIHAGLVKIRLADENIGDEELAAIGRLIDRLEDILPELHKADRTFDVSRLFGSWGMGASTER